MLSKYVNIMMQKMLSLNKGLIVVLLIVVISFPVSSQPLFPSKILLTFSEPMSRENIFDPENYKVIANDDVLVTVLKVGLVEGDSSVVLFINKNDDWSSFTITIRNLKDKAGNMISDENNVAEFNMMLPANILVTKKDAK